MINNQLINQLINQEKRCFSHNFLMISYDFLKFPIISGAPTCHVGGEMEFVTINGSQRELFWKLFQKAARKNKKSASTAHASTDCM